MYTAEGLLGTIGRTLQRHVLDFVGYVTNVLHPLLGNNVSNPAQILTALSPLFSSVVYLTLVYKDYRGLPELHDEAEPTDWRVLLRSFNNVKTLFVAKGVVEKLSGSLQLDDGESPNDLLPELRKIIFSPPNDNVDSFTGFIDARQNAGHPVTLVHHQDAGSGPS